MKNLALIPLLLFLVSACSTDSPKPTQPSVQMTDTGPLELKDGSYVFISEDGSMHMTDRNGHPARMKDGVEMELKDGGLVMMKNKHIWRTVKPRKVHDHRKMK
jgi:hypothetical protein